ncbi:hypothetical protein N0V86_004951 [Didymella sp. IMI 355093]|nr:hypothetical protein N0V86_004951 [Didymella sp. IMI 355093]
MDRPRNSELLKVEEVVLNIQGLPGAYEGRQPRTVMRKEDFADDLITDEKELPYLRPCTILDAAFWIDRVEKAPVNTRGWVLQERLLSPRVLHFCHDQIAWECLGRPNCRGFDAAEGQPHGMSDFKLTDRGIVQGVRLKALGTHQTSHTPEAPLTEWARIVETYSKTVLTKPKDKLIAVAGMAKYMRTKINAEYVAGLWKVNLASQLLWRVEPIFDIATRQFSHPGVARYKNYRAPSFSWAAIDVSNHGIMYADPIPDHDLYIDIESTSVQPRKNNNEFGMLKSAQIVLWGRLRRASLKHIPKGRFSWQLKEREELNKEQHSNVYLDSPVRDEKCIEPEDENAEEPKAEEEAADRRIKDKKADNASEILDRPDVFVMPAAKISDRRSHECGEVICLLLKQNQDLTFSRIGITKLTPYMDRLAMGKGENAEHRILDAWDRDGELPHNGGWKRASGKHKVVLV